MSTNKFEGFFENDNHPAMKMIVPSTTQIIETMMMICGQKARDENRDPGIHVGCAAFLMLLADRMVDSYDEYASDKERELFPLNLDEEE